MYATMTSAREVLREYCEQQAAAQVGNGAAEGEAPLAYTLRPQTAAPAPAPPAAPAAAATAAPVASSSTAAPAAPSAAPAPLHQTAVQKDDDPTSAATVYPPRRDPFAPSRDNALAYEMLRTSMEVREAKVAEIPVRFRDASLYTYPVKPVHAGYRTTSHTYGAQKPRAIELNSAYYTTSADFTAKQGSGAHRSSSLSCSSKPPRVGAYYAAP